MQNILNSNKYSNSSELTEKLFQNFFDSAMRWQIAGNRNSFIFEQEQPPNIIRMSQNSSCNNNFFTTTSNPKSIANKLNQFSFLRFILSLMIIALKIF